MAMKTFWRQKCFSLIRTGSESWWFAERKMLYTNVPHLGAMVTYLVVFVGMLKMPYKSKTKKIIFSVAVLFHYIALI